MTRRDNENRALSPRHPARINTAWAVIAGMRPGQWVKNLFLFAGLVFTGNTFRPPLLGLACAGFLLFCALSSGLYLVNDTVDRREDRRHPVKRRRPVASGRLTPAFAFGSGVLLALGAIGVSTVVLPRSFTFAMLAYMGLTLAYTAGLKHVVLIDLFLISGNFVLRAVAGALAIRVTISPWLLVCTTLLALFLGLGKRRHELLLLEHRAGLHRPSLDDYTLPLIDQLLSIVTAATLVAYALYAFSSETASTHRGMIATTPFVMYGLFRYLYLIHGRGKGGSPADALLEDLPSVVNFLLWTLAVLAVFKWGT